MVSPNELLNKRFEKAKMGGYKAADVDGFMVEVASLYSQQSREIGELKRKNHALEEKLKQAESEQSSLTHALLSAQKLADNIVRDANAKADLTLRDAEIKAEKIVERVNEELFFRQKELRRIKKETADFRSALLRMYRTHLELIGKMPAPEVPVGGVVPAQEEAAASAEGTAPEPETAQPTSFAAEEAAGSPPAEEAGQETPLEQAELEAAAAEEAPPAQETEEAAQEEAPETENGSGPDAAAPVAAQQDDEETAQENPETEAAPAEEQAGEGGDAESAEDAPAFSQLRFNVQFDSQTGEYIPLTQKEDGKGSRSTGR